MGILTLSSTNPQFSHVISKNPATIRDSGKPFHRELRSGHLYGWFATEDNQTFRLWFKDHPTESSFAGGVLGDFEYLDLTRYASPYLPIMMIQTALATASKEVQEIDSANYSATAVVTVKVQSQRLLEQMAKHFEGHANIHMAQLSSSYWKLMISANTVFLTLNVLQAVCVLLAMRDSDSYVKLDRAGVDKYIRVLNNSQAPYYVRYIFGSRAITNRSMFDGVKEALQGPGMTMFYGDTRQQRYDAIIPHLNGKGTLYDIGCGEMFYSLRLSNRYETVFALDADQEIAEANAGKVAARKVENVEALHAIVDPSWVESEIQEGPGVDVLCTEVLEHMPREQADALLEALLKKDVRSVVVTVPNSNFNVNYGNDEEMRHLDHHYEPSFEEWCDHTVTMAAMLGWDVNNLPIGDVVNGQSVTTLSVFTRKEA